MVALLLRYFKFENLLKQTNYIRLLMVLSLGFSFCRWIWLNGWSWWSEVGGLRRWWIPTLRRGHQQAPSREPSWPLWDVSILMLGKGQRWVKSFVCLSLKNIQLLERFDSFAIFSNFVKLRPTYFLYNSTKWRFLNFLVILSMHFVHVPDKILFFWKKINHFVLVLMNNNYLNDITRVKYMALIFWIIFL